MINPPNKQFINPSAFFQARGNDCKFTACDFWQWAFSDFQMNNIRGILAEFIVAKALDIPLGVRHAWDDFDLKTPEGVRIEVKSGGYLQSWQQKGLSKIIFGGLRGQRWDHEKNSYVGDSEYRADVYVFAVQTALSHESFNPLDLGQWEFYVVPSEVIAKRGTKSIALSVVKKLVESVSYDELKGQF